MVTIPVPDGLIGVPEWLLNWGDTGSLLDSRDLVFRHSDHRSLIPLTDMRHVREDLVSEVLGTLESQTHGRRGCIVDGRT
jgi:hypothetical protein